jgi:EmrB/QacA subfamily drug resistance transporter
MAMDGDVGSTGATQPHRASNVRATAAVEGRSNANFEEDTMTAVQRWTLAVVSAATAMLMLDIAVVNTALSRIAEDLNTGLSGLQWVVDAYTLALAATVLSAGALADRIGRRKLFAIGMTLFTVASLACATAGDIAFLNTARAIQGIGAAILFAVSLALLANAFPGERERAKALAVYGATIGGAFAVGPLVGGALTSGIDWQWIFLINVPIGIASLYITRKHVVESRDPHARPMDWPGQITLTGGLGLLVLALLRGNEDGWTSALIVAEMAGALALLAAFVAIERRSSHPMMPLRLFRIKAFTGAQVAAFSISASFFAVFLYVTLFLQQILGLSAVEAGLVYLPGTVVMFVVAGATASLTEKVHPGLLVSVGLALVAAGMALATVADAHTSWTVTLPGTIVAMIGTGLFNPALTAIALGSVPVEQSGLAAGVNDTFRQAGIAVGVAALGALVPAEAALGGGSPEAYVDGLHNALFAGAGLAAVGAVASAALIGVRRRSRSRASRPSTPALAQPGAARA